MNAFQAEPFDILPGTLIASYLNYGQRRGR